MTTRSTAGDLSVFESHRALLVAHAYRMLGDVGRAEDMVLEAWLRWDGRQVEVDSSRAYLVTLVTRLCLNELDSATARWEESRSDRLPEPVALDEGGIGRVEMLEQVSMAFLVVLQRLTPAERAVLLLRDVFDFDYGEIAALVGKSEAACRKLLEHDAMLITDGGPEGRRAGGIRNLPVPLHGAGRIARFVVASARRSDLAAEIHELNGQPALVFYEGDAPFAALLLGVADGRIHRVFFHADVARLGYLGRRKNAS